jgi:hypothetical protein
VRRKQSRYRLNPATRYEAVREFDEATITELVRQMRERASFADTKASLSRLLETWADVLEGKAGTGWAAINREDLREAKECQN